MANAEAAARVLRDVLMQAEYRWTWLQHVHTSRHNRINQAAVAAVLAYHLADHGELAEDDAIPRRLKDRVGRALSGRTFTAETMRWVIDAFGVAPRDEARLWDAWSGALPMRSHVGRLPEPLTPPDHRTLHLQEEHHVGADGVPHTHETLQTIQARVDGLAGYRYCFDATEARVDSLHGGTAGPVRTGGNGLQATDIAFDHPLAVNATATLRYRTLFTYASPPPPYFRRAVTSRVEQVLLMVLFHPDRLPRQVWWAEWSGYSPDEGVIEEEPVSLSRSGDVHMVVAPFERAVVGFRWVW